MRLDGGTLKTLVQSPNVDWADSVAVAPVGDIWFTDSALTLLLDQFGNPPTRDEIDAAAPYGDLSDPGTVRGQCALPCPRAPLGRVHHAEDKAWGEP